MGLSWLRPSCWHNAREFYRYLTEVNQVPNDHVWLLLDEEATLDKLRRTLGPLLRRSAGKEDMVIIFLAGHGAAETDPSSPDGDVKVPQATGQDQHPVRKGEPSGQIVLGVVK